MHLEEVLQQDHEELGRKLIDYQMRQYQPVKQHTAAELEGHRIRIESPRQRPVPLGRAATVTDLETGEAIINISAIDLHIVPSEVITAQLTLLNLHRESMADGALHLFVREEKLIVHRPEVSLTAIVTQE